MTNCIVSVYELKINFARCQQFNQKMYVKTRLLISHNVSSFRGTSYYANNFHLKRLLAISTYWIFALKFAIAKYYKYGDKLLTFDKQTAQ